MNASLFVNIVKRQAANISDPISLQKGWVANGRATGSYKMMPFLGIRVQTCKHDSYSEKDRNQTSGQNIPPYKIPGAAKSWLMHKALLYGEMFTCTHSFCRFFARPCGL